MAAPTIVRVKTPAEIVDRGTGIARERLAENYSDEAVILAVQAEIEDIDLARAIVAYVKGEGTGASVERPMSWISIVMMLFCAALFMAGVVWLVSFIHPASEFFTAFLVVIVQGILLRMVMGSLRLALFNLIDFENDNSYPTNRHPVRKGMASESIVRLGRLRALMKETASRIAAGEHRDQIETELAQVNLTPKASGALTKLAQLGAFFKDFLPPYENKWVAYGLALAFIVTCVVVIESKPVAEGYTNYMLAVSGWIAGGLARAKPRPRPQAS